MASPDAPLIRTYLVGADAAGDEEFAVICRVLGDVKRTLNLVGDDLEVEIDKAVWDTTRDAMTGWSLGEGARRWLRVTSDDGTTETELRVLKGYVERRPRPSVVAPPPGSETPETRVVRVSLATWPRFFRDGRGGTIFDGTLNAPNASGVVDDPASVPANISNKLAIETALAYFGADHDAVPTTVDDAPLVGPLDWGNAPAITELDALLARCGHAACPVSGFDYRLRVVRLAKAGETLTLPTFITDHAEPYELMQSPSARATKLIVSSGRTRTMIVRTVDLADLEFVGYDERTGSWMNETEWTTAYPSEPGVEDYDAFDAGPGQTEAQRAAYKRQFRAMRIADGPTRETMKTLLPFPGEATLAGGEKIGGAPCVVYARVAVEQQGGQWRNDPEGDADPRVRLEGVKVDQLAGVFELPSPMLRVTGMNAPVGIAEDLDYPASDADAVFIFAHEANEGDWEIDYFARAYMSDDSGVVTPCGEAPDPDGTGAALLDARDDPATVHLAAPFLRHVMLWEKGETDPTSLNGDALAAEALKFAQVRASSSLMTGGVIELRGIQPVEPGDVSGAVTQVTYNFSSLTTIVSLLQHELPDSVFEGIERRAGRSVTRGLSRLTSPGSSAAVSDVGESGAPSQGGSGGVSQVTAAGVRGHAATLGQQGLLASPAAALVAPRGSMRYGRITGVSVESPNIWTYAVVFGTVLDDRTWQDGVRSVQARNIREIGNPSSGLLMNGQNTTNFPEGVELQPVAGVVELIGPFGSSGSEFYLFSADNAADGDCGGGE